MSDIQELTDHRPTHRKRKTKLDQLQRKYQSEWRVEKRNDLDWWKRMISRNWKEIDVVG